MVTMVDVARAAGVSVSTVSYVLTGARPISAATRERVEQVIQELGYTPNALARGLKGKRSKIIAMLYPTRTRGIDLSGLEYILGASDLAQAHGYHLLLWTTEADAVDDLSRYVRQGLLDGAVVMQVKLHDERIDVLRRAGLTFAMIGRLAESDGIDFADTDTDQCARVALDYLKGLGHTQIGCLNPAARGPRRGSRDRGADPGLGQAGRSLPRRQPDQRERPSTQRPAASMRSTG